MAATASDGSYKLAANAELRLMASLPATVTVSAAANEQSRHLGTNYLQEGADARSLFQPS